MLAPCFYFLLGISFPALSREGMDRLRSAALMPMCHEVLAWEYHTSTQDFLPEKEKGSNIMRLQTKLHRKKKLVFLECICELCGSPQEQDLLLMGGSRKPCHFGWTAPLIWRYYPYLLLIFSSWRLKGAWIINKLVESMPAIIACVINPEPMWFGELIKLLLPAWKFLLPAAGLDLLFVCICTFADACDHNSRSYIQGILMGENMHRAEENGKKCIMIHGFSGSSFQEREFIIPPVQEIRFVMRSLGVHTPLLEPWKKSPTLWSFALSSYSSEFFYLASCLNLLYLRDPSWEGQTKLAWIKGNNSVILGRTEVHVLSSPSFVHPISRWDA